MPSNKKISILFISINIIGVLLSFFWGVYGGSGGETTEGVYLILFYTNLISFFCWLAIALLKFSWWRSNVIWSTLVLLIYYPITSVVIKNKINNAKNRVEKNSDFGIAEPLVYTSNKNQVEIYLKHDGKLNFSVDTLLYSKSIAQILIICSVNDSLGLFKNFELFASAKDGKLLIHSPKGGNLISEDTNRQALVDKVVKWYLSMYSTKEDEKNNLWNNENFWIP